VLLEDDLDLTEEQRMMRETCRAFVNEHVIPFTRQHWQREWIMTPEERLPRKILEIASEIGIRTIGIPEEFGGIELDPKTEMRTLAIVAEEISRGDSGLADKLVQVWKVSRLLKAIAPRHLQAHWFPKIVADPSFLLAHGSTEPRGASDRWLGYDTPETAFQTKAVLDGNEWVINGRKQFVSNGYDAKLYVVYANTKPGSKMREGTSSFLIPRDTPGFSVARCNETLGGRFMNNGEFVFEDCRVPRDHCLAENDALARRAGHYAQPGRIIQASKNIGIGVAAFERTAQYVQNYVQGGRVLIKHQVVAARLADMATRICAVRGLLRDASRAVDERSPNAEYLCSMAKLFASEEILKVCQHAVELHGGNGTMLDFGIEKLHRDAMMFLHMDGTVDITRFKIVKSLFPEAAGAYAGPER
jgi:alkylation response protein AidB-like acyl-CoA dehydrogenase